MNVGKRVVYFESCDDGSNRVHPQRARRQPKPRGIPLGSPEDRSRRAVDRQWPGVGRSGWLPRCRSGVLGRHERPAGPPDEPRDREPAEAPAAYVRALDLSVDRLEQTYGRATDEGPRSCYDYTAPAFDFSCRIVYDESAPWSPIRESPPASFELALVGGGLSGCGDREVVLAYCCR
jgi:hypothetical protein